jgi:hypothetical protein
MVYRQLEASREKPYSIQGIKGIHSRMLPHERYCREARMRPTFWACQRARRDNCSVSRALSSPARRWAGAGSADTPSSCAPKSGHSARPGSVPGPARRSGRPGLPVWAGRGPGPTMRKTILYRVLKKQSNIVYIVMNYNEYCLHYRKDCLHSKKRQKTLFA